AATVETLHRNVSARQRWRLIPHETLRCNVSTAGMGGSVRRRNVAVQRLYRCITIPAMLDSFLIPAGTVITAKGDSAPLELGALGSRVLLLTLRITQIVEQEALDLSIWGSADGAAWG